MLNEKRIVYTAGTWDLFHIGHLEMIKKAWGLTCVDGSKLVVGVSTDELVEYYKGTKPFVPFKERLAIIKALKYPDLVVPQRKQFDSLNMEALNIDTIVIGDDWKEKMPIALKYLMKQVEVVFFPRTSGISTSQIKHELKRERE
jgi:glycerol-3-phosphate cytidylyltransferase